MSISEAKYIWMDGELIEWSEAKVHVMTHALHYGTAVFEGIRGYWDGGVLKVFRLEDHITRLFNSAKIFYMNIPYTRAQIEEAIVETIKANSIRDNCYIRPIVYRGYGVIGLNPLKAPVKLAIAVFPFGKYLEEMGVKCCVSSWRRIAIDSQPPSAKVCGNYVNSCLAKVEAVLSGFDEAIFLDGHGYVCEGTGENIFLVKRDVISTPSIVSGILEGVTRDAVMKIAEDLGFKVQERLIARSELYTCDEAFFTGTAAEITPIVSIDNRIIGDGSPGPVTRKIRDQYFKVVLGKVDKYKNWIIEIKV
jgi:branched-chain amino acid aminotransferase